MSTKTRPKPNKSALIIESIMIGMVVVLVGFILVAGFFLLYWR